MRMITVFTKDGVVFKVFLGGLGGIAHLILLITFYEDPCFTISFYKRETELPWG